MSVKLDIDEFLAEQKAYNESLMKLVYMLNPDAEKGNETLLSWDADIGKCYMGNETGKADDCFTVYTEAVDDYDVSTYNEYTYPRIYLFSVLHQNENIGEWTLDEIKADWEDRMKRLKEMPYEELNQKINEAEELDR